MISVKKNIQNLTEEDILMILEMALKGFDEEQVMQYFLDGLGVSGEDLEVLRGKIMDVSSGVPIE
jgi:hypothetical protein